MCKCDMIKDAQLILKNINDRFTQNTKQMIIALK